MTLQWPHFRFTRPLQSCLLAHSTGTCTWNCTQIPLLTAQHCRLLIEAVIQRLSISSAPSETTDTPQPLSPLWTLIIGDSIIRNICYFSAVAHCFPDATAHDILNHLQDLLPSLPSSISRICGYVCGRWLNVILPSYWISEMVCEIICFLWSPPYNRLQYQQFKQNSLSSHLAAVLLYTQCELHWPS